MSCPFTIKYQMQKYNLTEEEARYKIRSFKNVCIEYWLERGYTEQQGKQKIKEIQKNRNERAVSKRMKMKQQGTLKEKTSTCIEYYLAKGMTQQEAKQALKNRQSTFSLQKCIQKYGQEEGLRKFNQRQQKWQKTLNLKNQQQKTEINNNKSLKYKCIKQYGKQQGLKVYNQKHKEQIEKGKKTKEEKINGNYFFNVFF